MPIVFKSRAPFENDTLRVFRLGDAVQESFHGVLLKDLLKKRATRLRVAAEFRQHRGDDILPFLPAYSIACRYGDIGFSTRSSRA